MWAYIDSALNADKQNGRSSTGYVIIVRNTPVFEKTLTQDSIEILPCGSEFVACSQVVDEVLSMRDMHLLDCLKSKIINIIYSMCVNHSCSNIILCLIMVLV